MRFVCFGYIDERTWEQKSEDEQTRVLQDYFAFYKQLRESGHFFGGEGLRSVRESVRLCPTDGQVKVTNKATSGEQLGGFFMLEARDMNQAISLISEHPGLRIGPFEIFPVDEALTALVGASEGD